LHPVHTVASFPVHHLYSGHNLTYAASKDNEINKESHQDTMPTTCAPVIAVQTFEDMPVPKFRFGFILLFFFAAYAEAIQAEQPISYCSIHPLLIMSLLL
jgi:hypothetical protein